MLKPGRFLSPFSVNLTQVFIYATPKAMLCETEKKTIIDHTKPLKNSLGK